MIKFISILFLVVSFCDSYKVFSCERSFAKIGNKATAKDFREMDLETIRNLPMEEARKLTGEHFRLFEGKQIATLPFHFLSLPQVKALKYRVNDIFKHNIEMQEKDPEVFSLVIRVNLNHVSHAYIPLIAPKQIRKWEAGDIRKLGDIGKLKDAQIKAFTDEQIIAFGGLVVHFSPEQIQAFGENIRHFLPSQFALFSYKQGDALTMGQLAVLDKEQRHSLEYIKHYLYL